MRRLLGQGRMMLYLGENRFVKEFCLPSFLALIQRQFAQSDSGYVAILVRVGNETEKKERAEPLDPLPEAKLSSPHLPVRISIIRSNGKGLLVGFNGFFESAPPVKKNALIKVNLGRIIDEGSC